jgi:hypothetical protein
MLLMGIIPGNSIVSYYLEEMLTNAGIKNSHTQLQIVSVLLPYQSNKGACRQLDHWNVGISAFCLVCVRVGSQLVHRFGRKTIALSSIGSLTIFIFVVGIVVRWIFGF